VYSLDIQTSGALLRAGTFGRGLWETSLTAPLGINTVSAGNTSIRVYPNPAKTSITVKSESELGLITLYNLLGETVYTEKTDKNESQIDLSSLSSGIYFLRCNNSFTKIVKE
jgi:hypothetical protein